MQLSAVQLATRTEVARLARSVNARVGAPTANQSNRVADGPLNRRFKHFLDGSLARLRLPSVKIGTVVSDSKTNVALHAAIVPAPAIRG